MKRFSLEDPEVSMNDLGFILPEGRVVLWHAPEGRRWVQLTNQCLFVPYTSVHNDVFTIWDASQRVDRYIQLPREIPELLVGILSSYDKPMKFTYTVEAHIKLIQLST